MSELALRLIAENKKTCATFLDLGNCGLTEVPDEIGDLVWLEGLSFASGWRDGEKRRKSQNNEVDNRIAQLSSRLERLKNLKKLFLDGDYAKKFDLADLSPLANLSSLQVLEVSRTQIADLSVLAGLSGLQTLAVSSTQVTDLSPLAGLHGLQELFIFDTQVTDLSPLGGLSGLQTLYAFKTPIAELSPLTDMSGLLRLKVNGTKITDLNPLARLSGLQMLYVGDTYVADLSPLSGLCGLQVLYVFNTPVADLSPLARLNGLQSLDISGTSVVDLSSLASLSSLKKLNVFRTQVTDLSPLEGLSCLQRLNIFRTPVADLSPLAGLRRLQRLNISRTRVADLSPLQQLIGDDFSVEWSSSFRKNNGIYVEDCPLTNPPVAIVKQGNAAILNYFSEKQVQGIDHLYEAKLLLVGEGGAGRTSLLRRLYQPEHQLPDEKETTKGIAIHRHEFNVQDSRYPDGRTFRLNVWDFGGQEIYHATHQFFLTQRSLYVLLDDTRKDHKTVHDEGFKYWLEAVDLLSDHSPLLIFQNEKGGRSKQIDEAGIKGKFNNVKGCYQGNLEHQDGTEPLRKAIEYFALALPHIGEELPAQWLKIRADIEQLAQRQATISQQVYFDLYEQHLPFDRIKALHLSRYLHDLGVFLHFQDDRLLKRTVILQNHWATEAVFKVLDDEKVKAELGHFTAADCERLWQDSDYADMHPELLALMQKFELCYQLSDVKPETWLAPQLLPPSKPVELNDWAKPGDLVLRFCYEFLPKGLISRLMVRQHYLVLRPELGWLTGVLFERNETQVLVEIPPKGDEIVLRSRGLEHKELLSVISADLDALNKTFDGLSEKLNKLIPCYCELCRKTKEPEFFEQKRLLQRKKDGKLTIECPASYAVVRVIELLDGIQVHKMPNRSKEQTQKKIFISYSKHDNDYKDTLIKHLAGFRENTVTWNDRDLLAGEEWDERIKQELQLADIVLYLVTANSMATGYIQNIELPIIEQRCKDGLCVLVPVIVDFCQWEKLDFAKYNALPEKGTPVTNAKHWVNENQAWLAVVKGIERLLDNGA